jgi:tRNA(Arg) A34 adenosine deaminase TadA
MSLTDDDNGTPPACEAEAEFLARAVDLARDNAAVGQLPFGAVVVRDGAVLATGVNTELRDLDPIAHAEIAAVRNACRSLGTLELVGATVVSSCEPCAVCHAAAAAAGVTRILYAAPKEDVPELEGSPPSAHLATMSRMRDALRAAVPGQVSYVPTDRAREPFLRYLAQRDQNVKSRYPPDTLAPVPT